MQRARPVVAYDDLPHDRSAVQRAATQTDAPVREKRRKRNAHVRTHTTYHGPHWDEAPDEKVRDVPAWEEDSEDAMVASPVPGDASPFLDTVELPSGEALCSEEVWDDRFLRDAWDAAEAEYVAFHQQRTAEIDGVLAGKDAAWFRLPKESAAHAEPRAPRVDTPGWAAAQRIVASTPNHIPGHAAVPPSDAFTPPAVLPDGDTLQNLVMAWYYTGYYTALYQKESRG